MSSVLQEHPPATCESKPELAAADEEAAPEDGETPVSRTHRHSIITMGISRFVRRVTRTLGFGLDMGGTLLKFVCFEPVDAYRLMEHEEANRVRLRIRRFLDAAIRYSRWDGPDHLKYHCEPLGGIFHFLKMPTTSMQGFVDIIADFEDVLQLPTGFTPQPATPVPLGSPEAAAAGNCRLSIRNVAIVGVTGGGSRRFASSFEKRHLANMKLGDPLAPAPAPVPAVPVAVPVTAEQQQSEDAVAETRPRLKSGQSQSHGSTTLVKYDEMACLVQGVNFLLANVSGECYLWKNVRNPGQVLAAEREKVLGQAPTADDQKSDTATAPATAAVEEEELPCKQPLHIHEAPEVPYPYLLVNVGSGVSVLRVDGEGQYTRVGGSSVGGGTFLGLCRVFTGAQSFEESIKLAISGQSTHVDMLVSDIYGGGYDDLNLAGDTIASSFGKFGRVVHEHGGTAQEEDVLLDAAPPQPVASSGPPHRLHCEVPASGASDPKEARPEDLAASALLMVTINICSLVVLHAQVQQVDSVIFAGNFLAGNPVSQQLLTWALDFWSGHTMSALFLEHEGYFGAIGALVMSISDRQQNSESEEDTQEPPPVRHS